MHSRCVVADVIMVVALLVAVSAHAAPMTLSREAHTVAGMANKKDHVDGLPGVSRLLSPGPVCSSYNASTDVLLVADDKRFRTLNTTSNYMGTWSSVELTPMACSCVTVTANNAGVTQYAVFYVECINEQSMKPRIMMVNTSTGTQAATKAEFAEEKSGMVTITYYNGALYVLSGAMKLYRCPVNTGGVNTFEVSPTCTMVTSFDQSKSDSKATSIAVSRDHIVVITPLKTVWLNYTLTTAGGINVQIAANLMTPQLTAVSYYTRENAFIAASQSAVYSMQLTPTTTPEVGEVTLQLMAGTEPRDSSECIFRSPTSNVDGKGDQIKFCGIQYIYALSNDTIYLVMSSIMTVRALTLPPMAANAALERPPWPVHFVDEADILPSVYATATAELNTFLHIATATTTAEQQVHIDANATTVDTDSTWRTHLHVTVPQRSFDTTTTEQDIASFSFNDTRKVVDRYYAATDVAVYGDRNLMPLCNRTRMRTLEVATATWARTALNYMYIYTSPLEILPAATSTVASGGGDGGSAVDNANVTRMKLLLPVPFGTNGRYSATTSVVTPTGRNATTDARLAAANYSDFLVRTIYTIYDANHTYNATFRGQKVNLDTLTPAQQQQLRWLVYALTDERLKYCIAHTGPVANGSRSGANSNSKTGNSKAGDGDASSSLVPSCTPTLGITNMTRNLLPGSAYPNYVITIFVPETLSGNFDLQRCLDGANWSAIIDWATDKTQPTTLPHRGCDSGCIVGVAVAAAVLTALLVVVAVVLLSKRRRLAVVLAPPPPSSSRNVAAAVPLIKEPEFASTVDTDEASQNPLRVPW